MDRAPPCEGDDIRSIPILTTINMSIFSSIDAEHHREIISEVIAEMKFRVYDRHPDSDLTQGQVWNMLDYIEKECHNRIQE
jgi:hypothetical protein